MTRFAEPGPAADGDDLAEEAFEVSRRLGDPRRDDPRRRDQRQARQLGLALALPAALSR